jgi:hypothetical protein
MRGFWERVFSKDQSDWREKWIVALSLLFVFFFFIGIYLKLYGQ